MPSTSPKSTRSALFAACLVLVCGLAFGCAHMPRMLGGSGDLDLRLDGEQVHEASLSVGRSLILDMRDPGLSGYVFSGTVFDTNQLRLVGIEPFDGGKRIRYTFTTLAEGESEVVIKIRKPEPGYRPDVFKRVRLTITR